MFWKHVADSLGYEPFFDPTALETTTPLLHAGDRRSWRHELIGPLGRERPDGAARAVPLRGPPRELQRQDPGHSGRATATRSASSSSSRGCRCSRGLYLRERRGLLGGLDHDWLDGRRLTEVELESTEFNETYELQIASQQDDGRLREFFDPKTIVWFSEHPLRPHIEFRAGFLVVYVPGHLEDLGRVVWLLEAAERIAGRVVAEIDEARRPSRAEPAPG